jgi:hypothetical protein
VPNTDTLTTIYDFIERTEQKLSGKIIIKQVRTSFFELFANATSMENGVIPEEKKYYQASTQWVVEVITSQGETITLSEKIEDMSIFIMSEDYKLETSMNHEYVFIYNYNKDNIYRIIAGNPELWPVWSEKIIEPIVTETTTDRMSVEMFLSGRTQKNIEFFPDSVIIKQTNLHMNNGLKVSTVSITGYLDIGNYKMEPMFIVSIERTEGIKSVKIIDFWTSTGDNPANFNLHTLKIQEVYEFKINRMSGGSSYALLYEDGLREDENSVSQNPISNEVAELLLGWMREKK